VRASKSIRRTTTPTISETPEKIMSHVNWDVFSGLPGAQTTNFERLCRSLIRRHYAQFGEFRELSNQAGIEFDLRLTSTCDLGSPPRWFGWQCKWYQLAPGKALGAARRSNIQEGIKKTVKALPELTDWILWTRHTLTKGDQAWFYKLKKKFPKLQLGLMTSVDIEDLLVGPAAILREAYLGELIVTPATLRRQHEIAAAPFASRFQVEVHQETPAELTLKRILFDRNSWSSIDDLIERLFAEAEQVSESAGRYEEEIRGLVAPLVDAGRDAARRLQSVLDVLRAGDFDAARRALPAAQPVSRDLRRIVTRLRAARVSAALFGTNLLANLYEVAQSIAEVRQAIETNFVAVVAAAGDGKSELAVEITRPKTESPGGVLLLGRTLSAIPDIQKFLSAFSASGRSARNFEQLGEALNAAGERLGRRIPVIIDGLNEAEDPRGWKSILASARVELARFSNVLLVVTLRAEFESDCLPESTFKIELQGFRESPETAIQSYFNYYKIDASDAELSFELLQHPLTLRIFCEVSNPSRRQTVGVEALPNALTSLFDEYLRRASSRIAELSPRTHRLYQHEIVGALIKLGARLWDSNTRSIAFDEARRLINDSSTWDASLLRQFESAGLLVRTSAVTQGFGVAFAYDLLAGHVIAKDLLARPDYEKWISDPANADKFLVNQPGSHTFAYDILRSMVGLFPMELPHRGQLWNIVSGILAKNALLLTAYSDPSRLDRNTVEAFQAEIVQNPRFARAAFPLLRMTRAARAHPFDSDFLDRSLRAMSNTRRDEVWTEWLRSRLEESLKDVQSLSERWERQMQPGGVELPRARWAMWMLTTTVRPLRDHATRALYWFGLRYPAQLFALAIESLSVSDPYVPERTLAATYGAMLCAWQDKALSDLSIELPKLASELFQRVFAPAAQSSTRHTLTRQYCLGLIHLSRRLNSAWITSAQADYLRPPFGQMVNPFQGSASLSEEEIKAADDAALTMDFGNYTLGRLIEDRANYDFKNPEYVAVRRDIVVRMIKLGYDPSVFEGIDQDIQRGSYRSRHARKIDRYGKKYGWIAYFEMWGWRCDQGALPKWRGEERTPDVDVDPCFPPRGLSWAPKLPDMFDTPIGDKREWLIRGPTPDYQALLFPESVGGVKGNWILLDGFVQETSRRDSREAFTFLRGVLVEKSELQRLLGVFERLEYPGNDAIPKIPEHYYTYAGEMIFAEVPASDWVTTLQARDNEDRPEVTPDRWRPGKGVEVEIPVQSYSWESYHSEINDGGGATIPSSAICGDLKLGVRHSTWDLYDSTGVAAIFRTLKCEGRGLSGRVTYLRADLLDRYLSNKRLAFALLIWGERDLDYRVRNPSEDLHALYGDHQNIHKRAEVWPQLKKSPLPRAQYASRTRKTSGTRKQTARKARRKGA